ncbi:Phosphatidylinositol 3-kinase [Diplonema papillatum]|nr:Phosphatidylinositol 3-kinase [Diplonema papillatum]
MMADGLISSSLVGQEAANSPEPLTYCYHKDVDLLFKVKIDELEGELSSGSEAIDSADLYVVVTLYDGGQPLCASSYSTRCKSRPKNTSGVTWTDWIVMPIAVSDMPLDTLLCFTVWSSTSKDPVGGTTCYVFSTTGQLKRGQRRLQLHEGVPADGSDPSTTLGKVTKRTFESRTDKLLQRYKLHQINKIAWLDTLTFRQVTKLQHEVNERNPGPQALLARARQSQPYDSAPRHPILVVSFPRLPVPVFHQSLAGPIPASYPAIPQTGLVSIRDPEMDEIDNPCEVKAVKIMKYHHLVVDPDIKPNTGQYTKIQATLRGSPLKAPSTEECHLLWQFRYFLWKKKIGFTRFMRCVDWADAQELKEAVKMVPGWSGLTLENCLELLSAPFKGVNPVRQHAVKRLREETTETLMTILLQLVQALRYEDDALQSSLFELLTERAHENWELCSHFFWYSKVELHGSPESSALFSRVNDHYIEALRAQKPSFAAQIDKQLELMGCFTKLHESTLGKNSDRKARVQDAIRDGACGIAQCFHGYAPHEAGAKDSAKAGGLMTGLGKQFAAARASVVNLGATYSKSYDDPDDKLEDSISELPGVSTPLFPDIGLVGMRPDAHIFSSAKRPMALTCVKTDGELERVMFKAGDDIRQDQLVLQIINIMNELLLQDGLDLKLTPYRCLATSANDGLMEMVPDVVVLQTIYLNIHNYLRKYNYDEKGDFQLTNKCLDTWVRSNAGYAIITFILGIGYASHSSK